MALTETFHIHLNCFVQMIKYVFLSLRLTFFRSETLVMTDFFKIFSSVQIDIRDMREPQSLKKTIKTFF